MTTGAQFRQAAVILDLGASARSVPPASTVDHLQILAADVYISRWLAGSIVSPVSDWLLSHIGPFQDVLDSLAGDPAAITAQSQSVSRCADAVTGSVAQVVAEGERISRQHWTGPAAELYALVVAAMEHCLASYGSSARVMASGELVVGERVGAVRQYVTEVCGDMIGELANQASRCVVMMLVDAAAAILEFIRWASEFISMYLQHVIQVMQELLADVSGVLGQVKGIGDCMERAASVLEGHGDPGPVGALNPAAPAGQYLGRNPSAEDLHFAQTCYGINSNPGTDAANIGKTFGGYTRLSDQEVQALGIDPALLRDPATGFAAGIFRNSSGQFVVNFAGTDFGTVEDVTEDASGAMTMSPQSQNAVRLAQAVNASPDLAGNSVYVGHSLGGRLAAVASIESGAPAVTFNAAGVSPATVAYMASEQGISTSALYAQLGKGQVREYSTADDPLTSIQQNLPTKAVAPDGVGSRIYLSGWNLNPATGHGMDNVQTGMSNAYPGFFNQ